MSKAPIDMSDDELREEISRCEHRAVMLGETSMLDAWTCEAARLRRVLRQRTRAKAQEGKL